MPGNKIFHHIVYSVKGGCGKTMFALRLLMTDYILKKDNQGHQGRPEINYMFDMDFLGTSLLNLLSASDNDTSNEYVVMNDLIFNGADVSDLMNDDKSNCQGKDEMGEYGTRYVIPSSCHEIDKEQFHVKRKNTPLLMYDEFCYEMDGILSKIMLTEQSKNMKYRRGNGGNVNFIYDMPPNADGYTEALFDCLLKRAVKGEKVILYLVFNNSATLTCDVEWLEVFRTSGRMADNVEVCFINNDIVKEKKFEGKDIEVISDDVVREMIKMHQMDGAAIKYDEITFYEKTALFNYGAKNIGDRLELKDVFK